MTSRLNPYLNFNGNSREAMNFYKDVFGGELTISTFKEGGMSSAPEMDDKIMHAMLVAENGMTLMASDPPLNAEHKPGNNIYISLSGDNEAELKGYWDKLSDGAKITAPLMPAPWGDQFGMLVDKFGIQWMVNIAGQKS